MAANKTEDKGIFERPKGSGIWWARWKTWDDRDRRKKVGSKKAALHYHQERRVEALRIRNGLQPPPEEVEKRELTVSDLIERYDSEFALKKSYREDQRHARLWKRELGNKLASSVRPGHIEAWKARRLQEVTGSTCNRSLAFLKTLFGKAVRDELLSSNPLAQKRVKMCRENPHRDRFLSRDEEAILSRGLDRLTWLAFFICLQSGLRQGELLPRTRKDVSLRNSTLRLETSKAGKAVTITLNSMALEAIREAMGLHSSEWVFPNEDGSAPVSGGVMTDRLQRACTRFGIKGVCWHTSRHTFVTRLAMLGTPLPSIQKLARHSSITTTLKYAHHCPSVEKEALGQLAQRYPEPGSEDRENRKTSTTKSGSVVTTVAPNPTLDPGGFSVPVFTGFQPPLD